MEERAKKQLRKLFKKCIDVRFLFGHCENDTFDVYLYGRVYKIKHICGSAFFMIINDVKIRFDEVVYYENSDSLSFLFNKREVSFINDFKKLKK